MADWKIIAKPGDYRILDDEGMRVFRGQDLEAVLTHLAMALRRERGLINAIGDEIAQLEAWAGESQTGGWSTHQVDPMRKRADDLRRVLMPGTMMKIETPGGGR